MMKLRLTRIPPGYGGAGLEILPNKQRKIIEPRGLEIYPILKILDGDIADILDLLDRGFGLELISWNEPK